MSISKPIAKNKRELNQNRFTKPQDNGATRRNIFMAVKKLFLKLKELIAEDQKVQRK